MFFLFYLVHHFLVLFSHILLVHKHMLIFQARETFIYVFCSEPPIMLNMLELET